MKEEKCFGSSHHSFSISKPQVTNLITLCVEVTVAVGEQWAVDIVHLDFRKLCTGDGIMPCTGWGLATWEKSCWRIWGLMWVTCVPCPWRRLTAYWTALRGASSLKWGDCLYLALVRPSVILGPVLSSHYKKGVAKLGRGQGRFPGWLRLEDLLWGERLWQLGSSDLEKGWFQRSNNSLTEPGALLGDVEGERATVVMNWSGGRSELNTGTETVTVRIRKLEQPVQRGRRIPQLGGFPVQTGPWSQSYSEHELGLETSWAFMSIRGDALIHCDTLLMLYEV